jgi:hypothetical protein
VAFDSSVVDVPHFLDTLEIRNVSQATSHEMRFSCPFPNHDNGDENASAYMNIETGMFFCHGCKERGSAVDFASHVLSISPLEAIRLLKSAYNPGGIDPDARNVEAEVKKILAGQIEDAPQPILDDSILDDFAVNWPEVWMAWQTPGWDVPPSLTYMLERGFEPETLEDWEFGFDARTNRITIPVRDEQGRLIGFKARAWDDRQPKYLVLGDPPDKTYYGWPRYYPSRVVFGAHKIARGSHLIVCEGELNAIATTQKTGLPAVAINGSRFSDHHARVIRQIANEVTLFLDCDKAGDEATWGWRDSRGEWHLGIVDRLMPFCPVYVTPFHAEDAAKMETHAVKACIEDATSALLSRLGC